MIILGIDPGTTRIGYGVIEKNGNKLIPLRYGLVEQSQSDKYAGIKEVHNEIQKIIARHQPDVAAVEKLFFFKNQKTIMAVSEMKGVILSALTLSSIPVQEFTPLQIKQAVSSYGRAGKNQVQDMVRMILGIKDKIRPDDAADGLAIAICCANTIIGKI